MDPRLLFELTKPIVTLGQHAHVLGKHGLECSEFVLALVLPGVKETDIRPGDFLGFIFLPVR